MDFFRKISKVRSLPEKKKKIIFWTLVIIIAFFLFFAWVEDVRTKVNQMKEEKSSLNSSFERIKEAITFPDSENK